MTAEQLAAIRKRFKVSTGFRIKLAKHKQTIALSGRGSVTLGATDLDNNLHFYCLSQREAQKLGAALLAFSGLQGRSVEIPTIDPAPIRTVVEEK